MQNKLFFLIFGIILLLSSNAFAQGWYIGVYNPNVTSCSTCHTEEITTWEQTGHAIAQDSISFLSFSCLECHNTGWDTQVTNGGADEFVIEDTNQTPNYVITDQTRWDLVKNIQCEQCHGPVGTAENSLDFSHTSGNRITDFSAENCGECHQDSHHPYLEEWGESEHAESIPVFFNRTNNGTCYRCHAAQDFIAYLEDPSYNGTTFVQEVPGMDDFITCATCHDPHGTDNPGNLRAPVTGDSVICDLCHTVDTEEVDINSTPHHTTSEALSGTANFGFQYPGQTYQSSAHTFVATERCINCHVSMEGDGAFGSATGHTFEPRVQACAVDGCHGENYYSLVDTSDSDKQFDLFRTQTVTDSLIQVLSDLLESASSSDSLTDSFKQAAYNLHSIESEGSHGIHNTKLVQKLLNDAIADFGPTSVEYEDLVVVNYSLEQNYPNPFNPSTTIKFSIPEADNIKLTVFDALGKVVEVLLDGNKISGGYSVTWDASGLASGMYFYQLETSNFVDVKKMVLIK